MVFYLKFAKAPEYGSALPNALLLQISCIFLLFHDDGALSTKIQQFPDYIQTFAFSN